MSLMRHSDQRLADKIYPDENLLGTWAALAQSDQTVSLNLVQLYKALGGGWEEETK
ncbi:MAG TPA: hypothetical protein VGI03_16560 [Verrucomicrobiae bacterium]|jgi:hypothetical protein